MTDKRTPETTDAVVKKIALACGFKLKTQKDGSEDINDYVYTFAQEMILFGLMTSHTALHESHGEVVDQYASMMSNGIGEEVLTILKETLEDS